MLCIVDLIAQESVFQQDRFECVQANADPVKVLQELQAKYPPYRFFFKPKLLEGKRISCAVESNDMEDLLKEVFSGSGLFINSYQKVFFVIHDQPNLLFSFKKEVVAEKKGRLKGVVYLADSSSKLSNASVYTEKLGIGTITNANGEFELELPHGQHVLSVTAIGHMNKHQFVLIPADKFVKVIMEGGSVELKEFEIYDEKQNQEVVGHTMGMEKVSIKEVEELPRLLGEPEVIQSILLMPGVTSVGEGAMGFNVRGGSVDQNLILFDDCQVFNPSHLFGFISIFNPDVIKNAELHKGSVPSSFGGRASSVLSIDSKDGDLKEWHGLISPGVVNSRGAIEGPIVKDKVSLLLAARLAYPNWILRSIKNNGIINQRASFADGNARITYWLNKKNKISAFGYGSSDKIKLNDYSTSKWQTYLGGIQWVSYLSEKTTFKISANTTNYQSEIVDVVNDYERSLKSEIDVYGFQTSLGYDYKENSHFKFGAGVNYYMIDPRRVERKDKLFSTSSKFVLESEFAAETSFFVEHELAVSNRLSINYGLRVSPYFGLGAHTAYVYKANLPKEEQNTIDSVHYTNNEVFKTFVGLEPRFSARYLLTENTSLKVGYHKMVQYLHLISNTASPQPFNIWQASNTHIKPINAHQYSLGIYNNLQDGRFKTSAELYYKQLNNILDYKNGANLLFNRHLETDLLIGQGKAYGLEIKAHKSRGKVQGGFSYTYSRSLKKFESVHKEETINNGALYPADYDKPHDLTITGNIAFTRQYSMSFQFLYSTGRPFTGPTSKYIIGDDVPIEVVHYSERNQYRIPDFHRFDISLNFKKGHKKNQFMYSLWSLSVYNLYGRKNAYSIYFKDEKGPEDFPFRAYKLAIIGIPVPSISCQIKF